MILLTASAISFMLGIAVMPWCASTNQFNPGLVVTIIAGSTFMGIGLGGICFGVVILIIQQTPPAAVGSTAS